MTLLCVVSRWNVTFLSYSKFPSSQMGIIAVFEMQEDFDS